MKNVKKALSAVAFLLGLGVANAQLVDEQNVTITMDLQPILQLDMNGPQNIDFIFDDVADYVGGITKYGVTQLKVSSTVDWDLYAVGFGSQGTGLVWDQQVVYGVGSSPNAVNTIPCEALELRQDKANPFPGTGTNFEDYFNPFAVSTIITGQNNIYVSNSPYVQPADGEKYIAGGNAAVASAFVPGGSYLVLQNALVGAGSPYWYTLDYRIVPGLPATFPNAFLNTGVAPAAAIPAGDFAQPGVYTMNVKYVLVENQ
jgi:hypothetical protein